MKVTLVEQTHFDGKYFIINLVGFKNDADLAIGIAETDKLSIVAEKLECLVKAIRKQI